MLHLNRFQPAAYLIIAAGMLVPMACAAATIENVTISVANTVLASAPSGEIAPPPAAPLTVTGATWKVGYKQALNYLQKTVTVSAVAAGKPFRGNYKIIGISGDDKTVKLAPAS